MSNEEHVHIHNDSGDSPKSNIFIRVIVIACILLILFFIAIGIVKLVPKIIATLQGAGVSFSSTFKSKEKLGVSVVTPEVKSGEKLKINWSNNTEEKDGNVMWSYACIPTVSVEYDSVTGKKPVVCDTLFPLPKDSSEYSFTVSSNSGSDIEVPMSVSVWDKYIKKMIINNSSSFVINPKENTSGTSTNKTDSKSTLGTSSTNTSSSSYKNTSTYGTTGGDLAINLVKVGYIDSNGNFIQSLNPTDGSKVMLQFNVSNVGSGRSAPWYIRAILPSKNASDKNFTSGLNGSLNPGDSFLMTLAFDSFDANQKYIRIDIDAVETNKVNNSLIVTVNGVGYNGSNGGYSGSRPDLTVRILDVGIMDRYNNQFYYTNTLNRGDKIAVKFEVENIGGSDSGIWNLEVRVPTSGDNLLQSNNQPSIGAGKKTQFVIGFDNPQSGSQTITIDVDKNNYISENNESNNSTNRSIYINY